MDLRHLTHPNPLNQISEDTVAEEAVVVEVLPNGVRVESQRRGGCSSCSARGGCGVGLMQKALNRREHQVFAQTDLDLRVGDRVTLILPQAALVQASLWMYLVPLLGLMLGVVAGHGLLASDLGALLGGVVGMAAAIWLVSARQGRQLRSGRYAPRIGRVIGRNWVSPPT